jgi:hypothetical protein
MAPRPAQTALASWSSAYRLGHHERRETLEQKGVCVLLDWRTVSRPPQPPIIGTARGSSKTLGWSKSWWAARRMATLCAVRLNSLVQRKLSCLRGGSPGIAFFTRTYIPQKLPGINAQFVAVIPMKLNGVFAHSVGRQGLGHLLEHRKRAGREFRPLAGLAARLAPLVVTKGAGTSIAQKGERVVRTVTVLPFDVQA